MATFLSKAPAAAPSLPPRDRHTWTLAHAESAVLANFPGGRDAEHEEAVYGYVVLSNHFQEAKNWKGAGYTDAGELTADARSLIDRTMAPVPEAKRALVTRVNGICANEADFSCAPREPAGEKGKDGVRQPSQEQSAAMEQWKREKTAWWDDNHFWGGTDIRKPTGIRGAVTMASMYTAGCACVRVFFDPDSRTLVVPVRNERGEQVGEDRQIPEQGDRIEAGKHIKVVALPPHRCGIYTDPDTQKKTAVFLYTTTNDKSAAEVWFAENGQTVLRSIVEGENPTTKSYPWGGLLPIAQLEIGCLLTPDVIDMQGVIDTDNTSLLRNSIMHGYSQRTELNAEEDGTWEDAPPTGITNPRTRLKVDGQTLEYFHPGNAVLGGGFNRRVVGLRYPTHIDVDNVTHYALATPNATYHEPSPSESNISTLDTHIMQLREACHQGHIMSGLQGRTAEASGDAYEQKRAPHVVDIKAGGEAVDAVVAHILMVETVMEDYLCGKKTPEFMEQYTVQAQSHPSAGAPSTESQRTAMELKESDMLDEAEAIARVGVQDVGGTIDKIRASRSLARTKEIVAMAAEAAGANLNVRKALVSAGIPEDEADEWIQSDGLPRVEQ